MPFCSALCRPLLDIKIPTNKKKHEIMAAAKKSETVTIARMPGAKSGDTTLRGE